MSEKKKYIVEAGDDIQLITLTGVKDGSAITMTGVIDTLETTENLEEEAYKRGHDTGYKKCLSEHEFDMPCSICDDYERGLNDAWDAARKINLEVYDGGLSVSDLEKIFAIGGNCAVMRTFTAKEAIDRIKAHEAEKDEIHVGDEVRRISDGVKYVVVDPKNEFGRACGFSMNGIWYGEHHDALRKTGRRFDMESILKEMSE